MSRWLDIGRILFLAEPRKWALKNWKGKLVGEISCVGHVFHYGREILPPIFLREISGRLEAAGETASRNRWSFDIYPRRGKIPIGWWRLSRNGIGLVLFCVILNEIIFLEVIKRFCNHQTCTSWKWKTLTRFEYFNLTVNSCAYWVLAHNGRTIISVELTSLLDWRKNSRKRG